MIIYDRLKNKIRRLLHKNLLWKYGFGNRVAKSTWEKQFANGDWDVLASESEAKHYEVIVQFYNNYARGKAVLDVGCGQGVLYGYLNKANPDKFIYQGIDISENAIKQASRRYENIKFKNLDFENEILNEKFDVIIFNESLYYFNRPLSKIKGCVQNYLNKEGLIIISMCNYLGNDVIWEKLKKNYQFLETRDVVNKKEQEWKVALLKP